MDALGQLAAVPVRGLDGVDAEEVHGVDLLEAAVLGLDHEEVDDDDEGTAAAGEDEAVEVVDRVGDEAGEEGDHTKTNIY